MTKFKELCKAESAQLFKKLRGDKVTVPIAYRSFKDNSS
jgi:hypothetical protein